MSKLSEAIFELLEAGADPNDLEKEFEIAVRNSGCDWALFGDGRWRKDTVCSICGLWVAGICGHEKSPNQEIILRSEYERRNARKEMKADEGGGRCNVLNV